MLNLKIVIVYLLISNLLAQGQGLDVRIYRRQNLMSKVDPHTEKIIYLKWLYTHSIGTGIQMKRKELTKTHIMI